MVRAVTLIELVITIAIIGLLSLAGIPAFQQFGDRRDLEQATQRVVSVTKQAQALALAPAAGKDRYIVRFEPPATYRLYAGDAAGEQELSLISLPQGVTFAGLSGPADWIFFTTDRGKPAASPTITLQSPSGSKTVVANSTTGLIESQ